MGSGPPPTTEAQGETPVPLNLGSVNDVDLPTTNEASSDSSVHTAALSPSSHPCALPSLSSRQARDGNESGHPGPRELGGC